VLDTAVWLEVDGIPISGRLYLPGSDGRYPAVGICHGIPSGKPAEAGDGGYPLLAAEICRQGFAVLIFNFRGAGDSGGNLDMLGWTRDLTAVIDYLWGLPVVDRSHLALLGFSGGAAVAVYVAARDKRVALVAACACPAEFSFFDDATGPQAVVDYFRGIGTIRDADFPPSAEEWFNGFRVVSPINCVGEVAPRPLLLVHGDRDETVSVSHAHRLYERAGEPKRLVVIEGAGHRLRQDAQAVAAVIGWLRAHCQR